LYVLYGLSKLLVEDDNTEDNYIDVDSSGLDKNNNSKEKDVSSSTTELDNRMFNNGESDEFYK
jgi:hypothetical protein